MMTLLLILLPLCLQLSFVSGHGMLSRPAPRNLMRRVAGIEYCPHCLSSGGPSVVKVSSVVNCAF
jgi:hypothetical protein